MSKHQLRFINVARYLETNLDADIDLDSLCKLACLSKYHFHRQCSTYFGVSVIKFRQLLKLKRAAYQLAFRNDMKVVDIAIACGYNSHEAFSRVFKQHFNKCPRHFRQSPDWHLWHDKYEPVLSFRKKIMAKNENYKVDVVDFPRTPIAVLEHRGTPLSVSTTIQKFIEWRKYNRLPPHKSRTFNLVYDDPNTTAPDDYRFDVCCEFREAMTPNAQGVIEKVIPSGQCARIRHQGSDDTIGETVNYLYSVWLVNSDYELRDFPLFFERVMFYPEVTENEVITDVYLPLQRI